jgi:hypothetical protein
MTDEPITDAWLGFVEAQFTPTSQGDTARLVREVRRLRDSHAALLAALQVARAYAVNKQTLDANNGYHVIASRIQDDLDAIDAAIAQATTPD